MTADQWEPFVAAGVEALARSTAHIAPTTHPWEGMSQSAKERNEIHVRAVLATVGPLIAEDTRERMVAAAGAALEREPALHKRWAVRRVFARTWIEEFVGTEAEVDEYLASVYVGLPAEKHHLVHKASMLTSDWTVVP